MPSSGWEMVKTLLSQAIHALMKTTCEEPLSHPHTCTHSIHLLAHLLHAPCTSTHSLLTHAHTHSSHSHTHSSHMHTLTPHICTHSLLTHSTSSPPLSLYSVTRLPSFDDQDLVVHVPEDAIGTEITYFSVWCRSNNVSIASGEYHVQIVTVTPINTLTTTSHSHTYTSLSSQVNLGHVQVPEGLIMTPPPPLPDGQVHLGSLTTRAHNVQGDVFALSNRTLLLTHFTYDGSATGEFQVFLAYI